MLQFIGYILNDPFICEILDGLAFNFNLNLYLSLGYYWYLLNRLTLYLANIFHISEALKERILEFAKYFLGFISVASLIAYTIIIILDYQPISFQVPGKAKPSESHKLRSYRIAFITLSYVILLSLGCMLLRQVNKYSTEKPYKLIVSLVICLIDMTVGTCMMIAMLLGHYIYNSIIL
jgi:hypothetical protein